MQHAIEKYKLTNTGFEYIGNNTRKFIITMLLGIGIGFCSTLFAYGNINTIDDTIPAVNFRTGIIDIRKSAEAVEISPEAKTEEAISKYIRKANTAHLDLPTINEYAKLIVSYSNEFQIDPFLFAALITVESGYNNYAISKGAALGLTQAILTWHKEKIKIATERFGYCDPFNPEHSIFLGGLILKEYSKKRNLTAMLTRYNGADASDHSYAKLVIAELRKARKFHST